MAITATTASSGKGYTPTLSAATQASLEKGRQERAAKVAEGTAAKETTATPATKNTTATSSAAAPQSSSAVTPTQKTSSTTVNISGEARAKLEAEKSGGTAQGSSSSSGLTYSATPTKFRTATAQPAQNASTEKPGTEVKKDAAAPTKESTTSGSKPQSVKFGSVDEAIAYGTRRANEQAAAKSKALQA